jgi:hypothetical protein
MNQTYQLASGETAFRLWGALFLCGVFIQALSIRFRRHCGKPLAFTGAGMVLAAAALDRDLTLAVGQMLILCLWWRHYGKRP